MSTTNKLTAMQNQVFAQMVANPDISENFSPNLKNSILKVGMAAVLSVTAVYGNMAQASDNGALRAMAGIGAVSGLLSNNSRVQGTPVECNIQGVSGVKVGGSIIAGSYVGNQGGGGHGKDALVVTLGALAGAAAMNSEQERIEQAKQDCYRMINARNNANYNNSNYNYNNNPQYQNIPQPANVYNNGNYNNGNYNNNAGTYRQPSYYPNQNSPFSTPIYTYVSHLNGQQVVVTNENSVGINALKGMRDGVVDPYSDSRVGRSIERSLNSLENSYEQFQRASDEYIQMTQNNSYNNKSARYASNSYEDRQSQNIMSRNTENLNRALNNWNQAFDRWARERAGFVALIDTAVIVDNIKVSSYSHGLQLLTPPQNASIVCNCDISRINKTSTVPERITMER